MKVRSATLLLLALAAAVSAAASEEPSFKIVVNSSNPISSLSKEEASKIFLKKEEAWGDGAKIVPIDQAEDSAVRVAFCRVVHGRKMGAIKSYWQQAYFSGNRTPPPWMSSDENVLQFIATNPRAIGYVSASIPLGANLKTVRLED
jgi:ABC-type phosphate transport system substrate-binding protein